MQVFSKSVICKSKFHFFRSCQKYVGIFKLSRFFRIFLTSFRLPKNINFKYQIELLTPKTLLIILHSVK